MMDTLLGLLKSAAPMLATAVAGPAGGAAVGWIADKLGIPDATVEGVTAALPCGTSCLIPAAASGCTITPHDTATLLLTTLPL
jgi:hypothetical protein